MKNILVVDDDSFLTDDVKAYVEFEGYHCDVDNSADEFFEQSADVLSKYSCIILDVMMKKGRHITNADPKVETGECILKEIRDRKPNMPVIILTAKNKSELNIKVGDDDVGYVTKPLGSTASDLINKINNYVQS